MDNIIQFIFITLSPFIELRGSIPFAIINNYNIVFTFFSAVFINSIIVFPIFFFLNYFYNLFVEKGGKIGRIVENIVERSRRRVSVYIEKYGLIGLSIFVAIPLPFTGAWTGSIAGWILNLGLRRTYIAVLLGLFISATIIMLISFGVLSII